MNLSGRDLNLLLALRALLEEANVSRAGDRLKMGQSSMSSALSRLRVQFHDELLVRVGRTYELTPLARYLLPQLQKTLPLVHEVLGGAPFDPRTSTRLFTIITSDHGSLELKPALDRALALAPGIRFALVPATVAPRDEQRQLLKADFVLTGERGRTFGESAELFTDHYVCIVDAENREVEGGGLTWGAFRSLPLAFCKRSFGHLSPADYLLQEMVAAGNAQVSTSSYLPLPSIVAGTNLVAVLPSRLAHRLAPATGTVVVGAPFDPIPVVETLWWHVSRNSDPAHVWLRRLIQKAFPHPRA